MLIHFSDTAPVDGPIVDLTDDVFDNTIDGEPIIAEEPVIHPGGSQSVDYNKVSHVGVHSVVQVVLFLRFAKLFHTFLFRLQVHRFQISPILRNI